ncbi:MAG: phosphotransferase [Peptostreptococcaceae bacterium]
MENKINQQILLKDLIRSVPKEIQKYLNSDEIYDKTFSNKTKVLYIKDKGLYLKIGYGLEIEKINTIYFNEKGIAGEVVEFTKSENYDYLIVKEVEGENGIYKKYLNNPKKLAHHYGIHLRAIHSIKNDNCPNVLKMEALINNARENVANRIFNMQQFFSEIGLTPQKCLLILEDLKSCYANDAFLHGDYCLPNIIMDDYKLKGIVDLDSCGVGDRHYDICSGLRSLRYNLQTSEYDEIFLESYGYDEIDKDRLTFCKILFILN